MPANGRRDLIRRLKVNKSYNLLYYSFQLKKLKQSRCKRISNGRTSTANHIHCSTFYFQLICFYLSTVSLYTVLCNSLASYALSLCSVNESLLKK